MEIRIQACINVAYLDRSYHMDVDSSKTVGEVLKSALDWYGAPPNCFLAAASKPAARLPDAMVVSELCGIFGAEPMLELIGQ